VLTDVAPVSVEMAAALKGLAGVHHNRGDLDQALSCLQRALEVTMEVDPGSSAEARALASVGQLRRERKGPASALGYFERALAVADAAVTRDLKVSPARREAWSARQEALVAIGEAQVSLGDISRDLLCFEEAFGRCANAAPASPQGARMANVIGSLHVQRGELDLAVSSFEQAMRVVLPAVAGREDWAQRLDARSLNGIGAVHLQRGEPDQALRNFEQAFRTYRLEAPDPRGEARTLPNIGQVHLARKDFGAALSCFEQGLLISQEAEPGSVSVAVALNNVGAAYKARGQLEPALSYFEQAERLLQETSPVPQAAARVASLAGTRRPAASACILPARPRDRQSPCATLPRDSACHERARLGVHRRRGHRRCYRLVTRSPRNCREHRPSLSSGCEGDGQFVSGLPGQGDEERADRFTELMS
jgi:tetratricopeptide (TPR) repeat protein